MPSILGANTLSSGYDVANSVRFNDGDNARISKTFSSAGNSDTWTMSAWVKRSTIGANSSIFTCNGLGAGAQKGTIRFDSSDKISAYVLFAGSAWHYITSDAVYRDTSAWYHVVVRCDTTQSTNTDRLRLYVNGTLQTLSGSTYPDQNEDTFFNEAEEHQVASLIDETEDFDGYMAEFCWIDGSSLAPDQFGEFDEDSGIWKPINVSGLTFGTNGVYLDFEDSSDLGKDASGNSDWTATNLAATDQTTDTCTNNFATWNPLRKHLAFTATFSEGNTIVEHGQADQNQTAFSTMAVSTGKWYAEFQCSTNASNFAFGIARINTTNSGGLDSYPGSLGGMHYAKNGEIQWYAGGDANSDTSTTFAHTDIIGVLFDLDNTRLYFYKNDTLVNSGGIDYSVGTAVDGSTSETTYYFAAGSSDGGTNPVLQANFGGSSGFAISSGNADPDGYGNFEFATKGGYALCTKNLAEYG